MEGNKKQYWLLTNSEFTKNTSSSTYRNCRDLLISLGNDNHLQLLFELVFAKKDPATSRMTTKVYSTEVGQHLVIILW